VAVEGEHLAIPDNEFHTLSHKAAANLALKLTEHWKPASAVLLDVQNIEQSSPLRIMSAKLECRTWIPSTYVTFGAMLFTQ
jgi:hypothetical protein